LLASAAALLAFDGVDNLRRPRWPDTSLPVAAVAIAARWGDQVWIPWRPLATHFATGRHDHDEDGLHVRQLTALFPRRPHAFAFLPPRWNSTLLQLTGMNWKVALAMHESDTTERVTGPWLWITRRNPAPGPGAAPGR
jgi:hypothetical protein